MVKLHDLFGDGRLKSLRGSGGPRQPLDAEARANKAGGNGELGRAYVVCVRERRKGVLGPGLDGGGRGEGTARECGEGRTDEGHDERRDGG